MYIKIKNISKDIISELNEYGELNKMVIQYKRKLKNIFPQEKIHVLINDVEYPIKPKKINKCFLVIGNTMSESMHMLKRICDRDVTMWESLGRKQAITIGGIHYIATNSNMDKIRGRKFNGIICNKDIGINSFLDILECASDIDKLEIFLYDDNKEKNIRKNKIIFIKSVDK